MCDFNFYSLCNCPRYCSDSSSRTTRYIQSTRHVKKLNTQPIHWSRLLPPLGGASLALLADELIDEQINAIGIVEAITETGLWIIILFCWAWAIIAAGSIIADILIRSPSFQRKEVNASLIKITARTISLVIAVWVVLEGADRFGISIVPMLAGLGVGGLAIALAVRPTLENLIGGFILYWLVSKIKKIRFYN